MPQDLPPTGGYEPVQYKVRSGLSPGLPGRPLNPSRHDAVGFESWSCCRHSSGLGTRGIVFVGQKYDEGYMLMIYAEESPRAGFSPFGDVARGRGRDGIWILEDWEGD
jgi:hypothetical protein